MQSRAALKSIDSYVIGAVVAVSLFVSPWNSLDPVNLPKLTLLSFLSIVGFALLVGNKALLPISQGKALYFLIFTFAFSLSISFIFSDQEFSLKFYGQPGRNTGFLAYISLTLFLYLGATIASTSVTRKFGNSLLATGTFLGLYGLAQSRGFDFFSYLNGYGSDVFGTFGNPNFQSAFMGIVAATSFTLAALSKEQLRFRIFCLALTCIALLNIQLSSWQGFFVFASGVSTSLLIFVFKLGRKRLVGVLASLVLVAGVSVSLALFNLGPLASFLYKASLGAREIYWQAAINMIRTHPYSGVGPDGYLDWFRRSRAKEVSEGSSQFVADSAHNIPLDIGASGGLPLLVSYLGLILLTLVAIIIVVRKDGPFDAYFTALVSAWIGYQAQSLISINQLGLGVWGWTLTGLLIGYGLKPQEVIKLSVHKKKKPTVKVTQPAKGKANPFLISVTIFSIILGWVVSTPPYFAAVKYFSALKSSDAVVLQETISLTPSNRRQLFETARIFADNQLFDRSLIVLRAATSKYPDYFDLWQLWIAIPTATTEEIAYANAQLKRLDPNNPFYK